MWGKSFFDDDPRNHELADRIYGALPPEARAAFYQLVLYPVAASANLNQMYITAARNRLYAVQGRAATNTLADSVRTLFERDAELSPRVTNPHPGSLQPRPGALRLRRRV